MKFRVVLEYDEEAEAYAAWCPELPGCASAGETKDETLANIREAIGRYFDPAPIRLGSKAKVVEIDLE
ncbi:MAG: type II toxin-antitoxin system HicB family antitoxin [Planctomycetes bacterium]|nr:type II toxin-antitoxin system HicB family antitoxin [Planctomycetota bacterium]